MRTFLAAVLLLVSCQQAEKPAAPPPEKPVTLPTAAEAKALIEPSPEFGDFEFTNAAVSLPLQQSAMNEPAKAAAADLRKAGWIAIDGKGSVTLTAKAKGDKRFLVRTNGYMDVVPLAKKEFGEVTAVRPDPDGAAADFTWKWVPNEVGQSFTSGPVHERYTAPQRATATLLRTGDSWTVLRIRPAP